MYSNIDMIVTGDWEAHTCHNNEAHTWEPTDTQGYEMECTTCGICWVAEFLMYPGLELAPEGEPVF